MVITMIELEDGLIINNELMKELTSKPPASGEIEVMALQVECVAYRSVVNAGRWRRILRDHRVNPIAIWHKQPHVLF